MNGSKLANIKNMACVGRVLRRSVDSSFKLGIRQIIQGLGSRLFYQDHTSPQAEKKGPTMLSS